MSTGCRRRLVASTKSGVVDAVLRRSVLWNTRQLPTGDPVDGAVSRWIRR